MPGAYQLSDFLQESSRKHLTYGFKSLERDEGPKIGHGYGDKVTYFIAHSFSSLIRQVVFPAD